ncbi:hypothetical protein TeGR_g6977 [Tetraparma gracilis]|uniref:Serine aminopeptidase S33 domain-containing protein n=1 Tax=Tetraparma gracilis TaxID=2962635 RepID=A0ABQ6NA01_9STRA|nr:hypothetical protein TeGR_g6977 [Tetraparma gracilis]
MLFPHSSPLAGLHPLLLWLLCTLPALGALLSRVPSLASTLTSPPSLLLICLLVFPALLNYLFRSNDSASKRRLQFAEHVKRLQPAWHKPAPGCLYKEAYFVNERGMALMSMVARPAALPGDFPHDVWPVSPQPPPPKPKAVVIFCHGYSDSCTWIKGCTYRQHLVDAGYMLAGLELEGHGRSDGLNAYVPDWEAALADVEAFARKTVAEGRFIGGAPKVFVAGESMGGALAFDLADRFPDLITGGAILVSPMCAIHEKMKPPPAVIEGFRAVIGKPGSSDGVRGALGKLPLAPSADIGDYCYKDQNMRVIAEDVPSFYGRKPRLATARELLNVTDRISASLGSFDRPFLVLHGSADKVTDPALSQMLFDSAKSKDKTIKIYDGAWHVLTTGEPEDVRAKVFKDMIAWLEKRL